MNSKRIAISIIFKNISSSIFHKKSSGGITGLLDFNELETFCDSANIIEMQIFHKIKYDHKGH